MKIAASVAVQYDSDFSPFPAARFSDALDWAAASGFDGVELIISDPLRIDARALKAGLAAHGLEAATIATGQAAGLEEMNLTSPSRAVRGAARARLMAQVELARELGRPAVTVGSLRGRGGRLGQKAELELLREELAPLAAHAEQTGVSINLEAINRYETSLLCSTASAAKFLEDMGAPKAVGILFDTFHANIEDPDIIEAVRRYGQRFSHVHIADSNRRLPGEGHIGFPAVAEALRSCGYSGYVSLETLCRPSAEHTRQFAKDSVRFFR